MEIQPVLRPTPAFATETVVDVAPYGACRRVDIWEAWAFAQADVEQAYRAWAGCQVAQRRALHLAYRAALEREDQAAVVLAAVLRAPTPPV